VYKIEDKAACSSKIYPLQSAKRMVAYLTLQEISLLAQASNRKSKSPPAPFRPRISPDGKRYLSALTQEDSLRIQQQVEFEER